MWDGRFPAEPHGDICSLRRWMSQGFQFHALEHVPPDPRGAWSVTSSTFPLIFA